jgi:kynureninase
VQSWGVDFLNGGSVKWLCGGPGAGYLYVRPDLIGKLEPAVCGWFSHENPFAFAPSPITYAPDITRFLGGTPAMPGLYAAREGYKLMADVGPEAIRERSLQLTRPIVDWAQGRGVTVRTPDDDASRGGHVTVDPPDAEAISHKLLDQRIFVDYRPGSGIRISPHFFNTDEEVGRAITEIDRAMP